MQSQGAAAGPLEQALGLLGTLMLRNPEAAELAAESGCIDSCVEAMQACERDNFTDSATGTQWVARQVCSQASVAPDSVLTQGWQEILAKEVSHCALVVTRHRPHAGPPLPAEQHPMMRAASRRDMQCSLDALTGCSSTHVHERFTEQDSFLCRLAWHLGTWLQGPHSCVLLCLKRAVSACCDAPSMRTQQHVPMWELPL